MPPHWKARLVMAAVVAIGAQAAVNALSFLAGAVGGNHPGGLTGLAAMLFAPFALAALVLPFAAAPLAHRWTGDLASGSTGRRSATLLTVAVLAEAGTAGARTLAGLPAWDGSGALHGLVLVYASVAAHLFRRRPTHESTLPHDP